MVSSLLLRPPDSLLSAALMVSAWYSKMDFGHLKRAMIDGGVQTAVVMLLVAASVVMEWVPDAGPNPSGFCSLDPRYDDEPMGDSCNPQCVLLSHWFLLAFCGGNYFGGSDRYP